jgi:hypothetical protein
MPRERKKARKAARKVSIAWTARRFLKRIRILDRKSKTPPLGMNMFSVIIDDANFMPERSVADVKRDAKAFNAAIKANKPEMLVIAESAMTRREIERFLTTKATFYVEQRQTYISQMEVVKMLHDLCDQHHWSNFQRRRTVEQIAARVCSRNGVYRLRRLQRRVDTTMAASKCRG